MRIRHLRRPRSAGSGAMDDEEDADATGSTTVGRALVILAPKEEEDDAWSTTVISGLTGERFDAIRPRLVVVVVIDLRTV